MSTTKKPSNKETVYIDVDDEITSIIDKVNTSDSKIVALVLPKRATVMQSVVNMRLLKKAAAKAKKSIVLITNEAGLLPLAGAAGVHVAKSLQSKPEIPAPPKIPEDDAEEPAIDKTAPIGQLAAAADKDETETIELDNSDSAKNDLKKSGAKKPKGKLRHLKVPNFERFRLGVVLAVLGVFLFIIGWIFAFIVMPKATIAVTTDTTTLVSSFDFTASTSAKEVDIDNLTVPAIKKTTKKTDSKTVAATGEEDQGTKASGEVRLSVACGPSGAVEVPTGTAVSNGDLNFITQEKASLTNPDFSGGSCKFYDIVNVLAAENGDKYNLDSGQNFAVAGYSNVSGANNDSFKGGTSKIVKVVAQKDIDSAVSEITKSIGNTASSELRTLIESEDYLAIDSTLDNSDPKNTASPKVGEEATEVKVSIEIVYSMFGVKSSDLEALINKDVESEIDLEKQSISNFGLDKATFNINGLKDSEAFLTFRGSVTAGPDIDTEAIKNNAVGKKRGEIEKEVGAIPGVKEVVVDYSPFWVYSTPKAAKKITVVVQNPENTQPSDQDNGTE